MKFRQEHGFDFDTAWKHRDMKRAKEIYATSIATLCTRESENPKRHWWITKPQQDPPDGVIGTVTETQSGNIVHVREVEVMEYLGGNLLEAIKVKLGNKHYEPNTILVCLMSAPSMGIYNFKKLSELIDKQHLSLNHIFLAAHGGKLPDHKTPSEKEILSTLMKISLAQLKPVFSFTEIDPFGLCEEITKDQVGWMRFDGRGKKTGFTGVTTTTPPRLF